jgi:hypothetical protein
LWFCLVALKAFFPFRMAGSLESPYRWTWFLVAGVVAFLLGRHLFLHTRRAQRELQELAADAHEGTVFVVSVQFGKGADTTGCDQGVLWFENDAMYFTGLACSFCIGSQDSVTRAWWTRIRRFRLTDGNALTWLRIPLRPPREGLWVELALVRRRGLRNEHKRLEGALEAFFTSDRPTTADRQYPPFTERPKTHSQ